MKQHAMKKPARRRNPAPKSGVGTVKWDVAKIVARGGWERTHDRYTARVSGASVEVMRFTSRVQPGNRLVYRCAAFVARPPSGKKVQVAGPLEEGWFDSLSSAKDAAVEAARPRAPHRNPAPKPRTYAIARADVLRALRADGWDVRENLKVPHATHPSGEFRLWFKTQAIYYTTGDRRRGCGSLSDALSLWIGDIRTMPVAEVLADIERARIQETRGR